MRHLKLDELSFRTVVHTKTKRADMPDQKDLTKHYTNGEVTIVWKPWKCIHSGNCVRGLPTVFNTRNRPWIDAEGASTEEIIAQVKKCPSGALSYFINADEK